MSGERHAHLSQLSVERYLLGELDEAEKAEVAAVIEACPECARLVALADEDNRAFTLRPVPDGIRSSWTQGRGPGRLDRFLAVLVPVAAAAALAMVLWLPRGTAPDGELTVPPPIGERAGLGSTSLKGRPEGVEGARVELGFYVLRGGGSEVGSPGQVLAEGDRIQFWYDAPADTTAVLVGIDGRGAVTRYLPESPEALGILAGGKGHVVGSSVVLDDARGVERFFLCTGVRDGERAGAIESAARELARGGVDLERVERLPVDCEQASIWIRKE